MSVVRWTGAVLLWIAGITLFVAGVALAFTSSDADDAMHSKQAGGMWGLIFGTALSAAGVALVVQ